MASWKLCLLVLTCVLIALVAQTQSQRVPAADRRRGRYEVSTTDENGRQGENGDNSNGVVPITGGRRRGGRGRGNNRRRGRGQAGGVTEGRRGGSGRRRGNNRGGSNNRRRRPNRRPNGRRPQPNGGRGGHGRTDRRRVDLSNVSPVDQLRLLNTLALSSGQFGARLYEKLADRNTDNFVFSPLSVFTALTMLKMGATGSTMREIRTTLNLSRSSDIHTALALYTASFAGLNSTSRAKLANAVYVRQGFNVKNRYTNAVRTYLNGTVSRFQTTNPERPINDWVEQQTEGEIVDFFEPGFIESNTVMVLINAIYFKGRWESPFQTSSTSFMDFHVSPSETHQVLMMSQDGSFRIMESASLGASVLEMPYTGGRYALYILLPNMGTTLGVMESRLSPQLLNSTLSLTSMRRPSQYMVTIPKFSLDAGRSLKDILNELGIQTVFTSNARLNKIHRSRNTTLYASEVVHRAVIKLDEEGTVAAGATGVGINTLSMPLPFTADRPFTFVVRDKVKAVNLFMGRYVNPMGENLGL